MQFISKLHNYAIFLIIQKTLRIAILTFDVNSQLHESKTELFRIQRQKS